MEFFVIQLFLIIGEIATIQCETERTTKETTYISSLKDMTVSSLATETTLSEKSTTSVRPANDSTEENVSLTGYGTIELMQSTTPWTNSTVENITVAQTDKTNLSPLSTPSILYQDINTTEIATTETKQKMNSSTVSPVTRIQHTDTNTETNQSEQVFDNITIFPSTTNISKNTSIAFQATELTTRASTTSFNLPSNTVENVTYHTTYVTTERVTHTTTENNIVKSSAVKFTSSSSIENLKTGLTSTNGAEVSSTTISIFTTKDASNQNELTTIEKETPSKGSQDTDKTLAIVLSVVCIIVAVLIIIGIMILYGRKWRKRKEKTTLLDSEDPDTNSCRYIRYKENPKHERYYRTMSMRLTQIKYNESYDVINDDNILEPEENIPVLTENVTDSSKTANEHPSESNKTDQSVECLINAENTANEENIDKLAVEDLSAKNEGSSCQNETPIDIPSINTDQIINKNETDATENDKGTPISVLQSYKDEEKIPIPSASSSMSTFKNLGNGNQVVSDIKHESKEHEEQNVSQESTNHIIPENETVVNQVENKDNEKCTTEEKLVKSDSLEQKERGDA